MCRFDPLEGRRAALELFPAPRSQKAGNVTLSVEHASEYDVEQQQSRGDIMPGPVPKHHNTRARTNRSASRATLFELSPDEVEIPSLPAMRLVERKRKERDEDGVIQTTTELVEMPWRLETASWWEDTWSSPMASEYHRSDVHGLFRLAVLIDDFWSAPSAKLNIRIRLAQKDYGLTPLDRRRLEWSIASAEKATDANESRRPPPRPDSGSRTDPRLHII